MSGEGISKTWAFTLNNYGEKDIKQFEDLECQYIVFGREVGENGTDHLQGHIIFKNAYRLSALKKLNERAHWSIAIAPDASANYCMKDRDYFVKDRRKQGKRTDIADAIATVQSEGILATKIKHPEVYVKYHSGLDKLAFQRPRNFKPHVVWIWGPTGTGKTRRVVESNNDLWISGRNLKWWSGYENQQATLFDDFRGDFCTFHELLRILDRYPYTVEIKGGFRELNSPLMFITSCYAPQDVYQSREDIQQLIRRIDEIVEMDAVTEVGDR